LLADFGSFWELEPSPTERRKLLTSLFDRVWEHGGAITAVKPRTAFARYFRAAEDQVRHHAHQCGAEHGSDGTRTRDLRRDRPALDVLTRAVTTI
jgi:hypothetical protein